MEKIIRRLVKRDVEKKIEKKSCQPPFRALFTPLLRRTVQIDSVIKKEFEFIDIFGVQVIKERKQTEIGFKKEGKLPKEGPPNPVAPPSQQNE